MKATSPSAVKYYAAAISSKPETALFRIWRPVARNLATHWMSFCHFPHLDAEWCKGMGDVGNLRNTEWSRKLGKQI